MAKKTQMDRATVLLSPSTSPQAKGSAHLCWYRIQTQMSIWKSLQQGSRLNVVYYWFEYWLFFPENQSINVHMQ